MDVNDLKQVDSYIAPDGTIHIAPEGLVEDDRGLLYLNEANVAAPVNVEDDGKLTPAHAEAHIAAPKVDNVMHRRAYMYIIEPKPDVLKVSQRATLSQSPGGGVFSNGNHVADDGVIPIVEAENRLFLGNSTKQEVEIVEGKIVPLVDKQQVSFAEVSDTLSSKTEHIKNKAGEINIHQGANPISSFIENFLQNYRAAQKGKVSKTNVIDVKDLIDWDEAKSMGLSREILQKGGHLDKMLQGKKTDLLPITMTDPDSGIVLNTYARLSLKQDADGIVRFRTNLLRNDLDMTQYCGHKLTNEDRENLSRTGNLGRVIEVKFKNDEAPKKIFLSLDKQTNELIAFDASKVQYPTAIAGKQLTPEQRQALKEGKAVKIEGMKSAANGNEFTNTLQFSALEKRFVFTGEVPKIRRTIAGVKLTDEQYSKLTNGEAVQIIGMTDKAGKKYNAYARWDTKEERLCFSSKPNFTRSRIKALENLPAPLKAIGGKVLTEQQKQDLAAGKAIFVTDLQGKDGKPYHTYVTKNLETQKLEFVPIAINAKQSPRYQLCRELTEQYLQKNSLSAQQQSELDAGRIIIIDGLLDKMGQPFTAHVIKKDNGLDYASFRTSKPQQAISPTIEHKTQVAANNDGHKPKALESLPAPLEQKQPNAPTAKQDKQIEQAKQPAAKQKSKMKVTR
jgi:hypothetical protein